MNRKIVLVRPNWNIRWLIMPPLGLGYIVAAAKRAGYEATIYDAWLNNESPEQAAFHINHPVDIIGIQIFSTSVNWTRKFIKYIPSKLTTVKIIVGGPYVTALGDVARKEVGADIGIIGEFDGNLDLVIPEILASDKTMIPMPYTDVNAIPMPDWDSMPPPNYWPYLYPASTPTHGKRIGVIQRTRGCPFHCTFCAAGTVMGYKVRIRDTINVIEEIKYLHKR